MHFRHSHVQLLTIIPHVFLSLDDAEDTPCLLIPAACALGARTAQQQIVQYSAVHACEETSVKGKRPLKILGNIHCIAHEFQPQTVSQPPDSAVGRMGAVTKRACSIERFCLADCKACLHYATYSMQLHRDKGAGFCWQPSGCPVQDLRCVDRSRWSAS